VDKKLLNFRHSRDIGFLSSSIAQPKPHNVFNLAIGTDNLLHSDGHKRITASIEFVSLANKVALYNFLSTFSGTHFLGPRTIAARLGFSF
jgi:hypothetical protein